MRPIKTPPELPFVINSVWPEGELNLSYIESLAFKIVSRHLNQYTRIMMIGLFLSQYSPYQGWQTLTRLTYILYDYPVVQGVLIIAPKKVCGGSSEHQSVPRQPSFTLLCPLPCCVLCFRVVSTFVRSRVVM